VISSTDRVWDAAVTAIRQFFSQRKGHLDETDVTPPIDDTADLEAEILVYNVESILSFVPKYRSYWVDLRTALSETQITQPALTGYFADLQTALDFLQATIDSKGYLPYLITRHVAAAAPTGILPCFMTRDAKGSFDISGDEYDPAVGNVDYTGRSNASSFNNFTTEFNTFSESGAAALADDQNEGFADGYAGSAPALPGDSDDQDVGYATSYLMGVLNKLFEEYFDGNAGALSGSSVAAAGLIRDIGLRWKIVRDWYESDVAAYSGITGLKMFNDSALNGYIDAL
jgi:hypothetical protein